MTEADIKFGEVSRKQQLSIELENELVALMYIIEDTELLIKAIKARLKVVRFLFDDEYKQLCSKDERLSKLSADELDNLFTQVYALHRDEVVPIVEELRTTEVALQTILRRLN